MCLPSTAATITTKETIKEKAIGCSSLVVPRKCIRRAETSRVISDSAACLSTTSAPHEYFYQTGTYSQPNGGDFARVAVTMLDWQLKGEKNESKFFLGANCGLCQEAGWHVSTKGYK